MKKQWRLVGVVMRRELRDQLRDWRVLTPIIILTLFFPLLMNASARRAVDFVNQYGAELIAERMVPFFVLIVGFFPITVGLVVALEAFVGEKERGTIEPLLSSPLEDWQLYAGKFLAGLSLPLGAAFLDVFIYLLTLWLRNFSLPPWWMLAYALVLTAMEAVTLVSAAMFISTQSATVRGANLLASFIIIPMALLLQAESAVLFFGDHLTFWLTILGLSILAFLLIRLGVAHFQREYLLNQRNNALSPHRAWKTFWTHFLSGQQTLKGWYRELWRLLAVYLRVDIMVTAAMLVLVATLSYLWAIGQADHFSSDEFMSAMQQLSTDMPGVTPGGGLGFGTIFWHNLRAAVLLLTFGFVSVSLLGELLLIVNFAVIGVVLGGVHLMGYSALEMFLRGILPHGVFEIPAMVLIGALILRGGLVMLSPQPQETLGDTLLKLIADWSRVFVGALLPLLLLAAAIEAWITPHLLKGFF